MKTQIKPVYLFFACGGLCFFILLFFFIQAVQYKKAYDVQASLYRIFPYPGKKALEETSFKVVSEFRANAKKQGIAQGIFHLKGQMKQLSRNINGSGHGASKATPAVDESGIYIGADDGWFYKFSHKGDILWQSYFAKSSEGVHGTALLSKKYLYVGAYNGVLYCGHKQTGELIWNIDLGDAIGASPSFYQDMIIVSVEMNHPHAMGYVSAVSAKDGSLKWKSFLTPAHIHSSVAIHNKKGYGVTGANNGLLSKIDLNSGQALWTLRLRGAIKSTPLIYKNRIYVSHWGRQFTAIHENGQQLWSVDITNRSQSSPTLIPDKEYLIFSTYGKRPRLWAVHALTGQTMWKKRIKNRQAIGSGLAFFSLPDNRYLFLFPCENTALCVVDPDNGHIKQKIHTGFLLTGSLAFFKDQFYMSFNQGGLYSLH